MGKRKTLDGTPYENALKELVLLFASLFTIPLACQCCFDTTLLARLQVVGVTFDFLDDVFLLYLALKPAQCVFKRFAFLQANLCQRECHLQTCQKGLHVIILDPLDSLQVGETLGF
jgi:hypothetical protein